MEYRGIGEPRYRRSACTFLSYKKCLPPSFDRFSPAYLVRSCQKRWKKLHFFRSLVEKYDFILPMPDLFVLLSTNYPFEENNFFINFQFVLLAYCSAGYLFFENCSLCYNLALVWSVGSCGSCKIIYPKYSKH